MRSIFSLRSLLWPALVAAAFAAFFVITQPGEIYADAAEYDLIARSILHGRFELAEETAPAVSLPTMHREPGYPAFRAAVYATAGDHPSVILWIQALLIALTVLLTGITIRRIDPRWALPTAWLLTLYPGFSVWTGQHYSEVLAAFLASFVAWTWVRSWDAGDDRNRRAVTFAVLTGVLIGMLTLTKASFQLLPLFAAGLLVIAGSWKLRWKQAVVLLIGFFMIVTPWILRNKQVFNQYAITYRTGIVIYTRSLKAQIPWSQIGTSYGSVLAGQATMLHLFPSAPPVTIQLWDQTWEAKNALMAQGMRFYQADAVLLSRAAQTIFSSPEVFAKYILWSGVDELRFFEMTSPFSPKFGVEWIANDVAKAGRLSGAQLAIVLAAHALQLAWWVLIACGFIVLIRKRMWQHPSVLLIGYAAIMYAPFDNIPRYAVPVLPWIIALIVMAIIPSVFAGKKRGSVLMLAESTNPKNGWGVYARGLADALKAEGVSITMLTSDANSEGMRLPSVHASRWRWVCATIWLRTWLLLNPHRLIHVVAEPYGRLFRGFGQTPFLLTIHGTYADPAAQGPAWAVKAYTEALRQSSGLVTVSSYTKEQLPESVRQKAVVIPNGVDASIVTESFESATRHSAPLILSVGAIKPRKGFDRLMTGFAQFQKTHPDAELVIVGRVDRPDVRDTLLRHADSLGIADHVRLTGEVTRAELLGWYRACDVFALTPVNDGGFEGFGLVYLEANLFGKPAVGSRNSGAVDAIQEGKNGYLVDPERPEDIMRALDNAMTLQADQIQQTTQQKTWRSVAQAFRKLYDR